MINAVIIFSVLCILACLISIILAIKFQKQQRKKYENNLKYIKENNIEYLTYKSELNPNEIKSIDKNINVKELMNNLYNTYLEFENNINNSINNFDNVLTGPLKEIFELNLDDARLRELKTKKEKINLISYSIIEFNKNKLRFRININCLYQIKKNKMVKRNDLVSVELVLILDYKLVEDKWLIYNIEKVYEKFE